MKLRASGNRNINVELAAGQEPDSWGFPSLNLVNKQQYSAPGWLTDTAGAEITDLL